MSSQPGRQHNATSNPVGARTDVGCVRAHNEDSLIVSPPLYAVADGMGGHEAGEVASEIAIQTLADHAPTRFDADALLDAYSYANEAIFDAIKDARGKPGMGTTLTAALLVNSRLLVAQIGDSRAYLLRDSTLRQLTRDHSYVAELVANGKITPEEAAVHPKRSIITRALGSDALPIPDLSTVHLRLGDRILLCSDGLTGMVCDDDICAILMASPDPQEAADQLVKAARAEGGMDNITAVVVDVAAIDEEQRDEDLADAAAAARARRPSRNGGRAPAPTRRGRRLHLGIITFVLLFVLLVAGAFGGIYLYAHNVAFLRIDDGYVTVYRGLVGEVVPGVRLQWLEYQTDISESDLEPSLVKKLNDGVPASSLEEASYLVGKYREQSREQGSAAGPSSGAAGGQSP